MIAVLRALHAEQLKLHRTLALWLCALAPLVIVVFGMALVWSRPAMFGPGPPQRHWPAVIRLVMDGWALMMLPLFTALESALLAGLEHGNQQWKHLLVLPLPRSTHYLAKLGALMALVVLATLVVCLLIALGAVLLPMSADPAVAGPPPWGFLLGHALASVAAGLLMIALQTFIALRWRSFSLTMAVGVTATAMCLFIPRDSAIAHNFPWLLSALAVTGTPTVQTHVTILGCVGFSVVAAISAWEFTRREHQ